MMRFIIVGFCFVFGSAVSAQDIRFNSSDVETCLRNKAEAQRNVCVGIAANACIQRFTGGAPAIIRSACFERELQYWDGQLNIVYPQLRKVLKRSDQINPDFPAQWPSMRAMQRSWITYRDSLCEFEATYWQGGTGAGPAALACLMFETARQTLVLEERLDRAR